MVWYGMNLYVRVHKGGLFAVLHGTSHIFVNRYNNQDPLGEKLYQRTASKQYDSCFVAVLCNGVPTTDESVDIIKRGCFPACDICGGQLYLSERKVLCNGTYEGALHTSCAFKSKQAAINNRPPLRWPTFLPDRLPLFLEDHPVLGPHLQLHEICSRARDEFRAEIANVLVQQLSFPAVLSAITTDYVC